ncbi:hypothetical protein BD626DRAFT_564128 [Schizophyllum amplum]|uniref:Uncharacterized protein n=1 Tax=Schizophyllum amplum TaxID=97359 RepID=A0A550D0D5_9AGAR|nr:hypothetical protein BD626DRAFT_564128 [Auriculariopsis ampla]
MPRNENPRNASVDDVPDTPLAAQVAALARHGLYCRIRSHIRRIARGIRHNHDRFSPARDQQLESPDSRSSLRRCARYWGRRQATENQRPMDVDTTPSSAPALPEMDLPGPAIFSNESLTSLGHAVEMYSGPSPQVSTNEYPPSTQGSGRTSELRALRRDLVSLRDAITRGLAKLEDDPHTAGVRTLDIEESTCSQVLSSRLGPDDVPEGWQTVSSARATGERTSGASGLCPATQDTVSLSGLGLYLTTTDDQAILHGDGAALVSSSAGLNAHPDVSQGPEAVASLDVPDVAGANAPRPSSDDSDADPPAIEASPSWRHATDILDEASIPTFVGVEKADPAYAGGLKLVIDVGASSEVNRLGRLFYGDFDDALILLPGICELRKIRLTQLYLRIGQSQDRQQQDTMSRVMVRLVNYLRCFLAIQLIMDQEHSNVRDMHEEAFRGDFTQLRYLRMEGFAKIGRFACFPLCNIRQLDVAVEMSSHELLSLISRAKNLDVLKLHYYRVQAGRARPENPVLDDNFDGIQTTEVRYPPAMYIATNMPADLMPCIRAYPRSADLRLTVVNGPCPAELVDLFACRPSWSLEE